MSTRRNFLSTCCAIPLVALTAPTGMLAEAILPYGRPALAGGLSFESFARQLNTSFRILAGPGRTVWVRLDEARLRPERPVQPGRRPRGDAGNEMFSLIFTGQRDKQLDQDTYQFEHEALGRFDCFIVPVFTRNPGIIDYEVVINRPRKQTGAPRG